MQQRYYDPMGLFLSVDPVTAYDNGDMRHFNRYAYAYNNPYKFTDPDGRCANLCTGGVGAVVGAVVGFGVEGYKQLKAGKFDGKALAVETGKGAVVGGLIGLTGGAAAASSMSLGGQAVTTSLVAGGVGAGAHSVGEVAKGNAAPSAVESLAVGGATAVGAGVGALVGPLSTSATTSVIPAVQSHPVTALGGAVHYTVNIPAQTIASPATAQVLNNVAASATEQIVKPPLERDPR